MAKQKIVAQQFKYYTFLVVLYVVFVLTAQALSYRLIDVFSYLEPGGIFIFPATFIINDIITEVYGPTLAKRSIFFGLYTQGIFCLYAYFIINLPYPIWWHYADAFIIVYGTSWLVFISNAAALLVGMVYNTQLIAKTKILMRGKFFALRSILSSAVGELLLTAIIVLIALVPVEGKNIGVTLFVDMFLFKIIFSIVMIIPASFVVVLLKRIDQVDIYEDVSINPINLLRRHKKIMNIKVDNVYDFNSYVQNKNKGTTP